MPSSAARKGIWVLGAAMVLTVLVAVTLPLIASTQIVRDSIARQMSAWSGYRVELGDTPEIRVWPAFRAVLNNVTMSDWKSGRTPSVIEAERVEIDLSALAALRGEVVFTKVKLFRPVMRVTANDGAIPLPASSDWGRIARSVEIARGLLADDPANPDAAALPSDPFGTVEFEDGRIITGAEPSEDDVTGLTGVLSWPALNKPAKLSAMAIWHGESVTVEATSAQPLFLLAGGNVPVTLSFASTPITTSFDGVSNISANTFIDGQLALSSPSLSRLLEWTHSGVSPGSPIGAISAAGRITGVANRMKLENAEIALDDNPGTGALEVVFGGAPTVTGTLAFERLDLQELLLTLVPLPADDAYATYAATEERQALTGDFGLDLRLSAASAIAGSIALSQVAATAQVKDGLAAFDISDATAFGGTVQLGIRIDRREEGKHVELRITGDDIDGSQVASQFGLTGPVPRARGSFSVILKGYGARLSDVIEHGDGSVSATLGKGTIPGINLPAFLGRNEKGGFFPLSEVAGGELPIDGAELKATLSEGVARIDKAVARSGPHMISFGGLIPLAGRGIALSGTVGATASPNAEPSEPQASFFVGGSWEAPFIAPVFPALPPE